jgi:hypothetical protein
MAFTEVRPYPVSATVVMRSTLFALANLGATLQTYNEETGVIVATVSRWLGLQKREVVARVRGFEQTSQLEIDAPDAEKAQEIIQLVNSYVRDGGRIQANATIQWVDLARQQEQRLKRQELTGKARALISGSEGSEATAVVPASETAVVPAGDDPAQSVAIAASTPIYIPDNPGVLVKNKNNNLLELKVDPAVFTDRSAYLMSCSVCQATTLRGSAYCPNCGRPLTLEAVQPALQGSATSAAASSLAFGLAAVAFSLVPVLFLVLPAVLEPGAEGLLATIRAALSPLTIALAAALGLVPAVLAGVMALRRGQRASWYQNLPASLQGNGRMRASVGAAFGWLGIYISAAWIILVIIALVTG